MENEVLHETKEKEYREDLEKIREEELKELREEEERLREQLRIIAHINHMEKEELDEFWTAINQLVDNQIEIEKHCNQ